MKKLITLVLMVISITLSAQNLVVVAESTDGGVVFSNSAGFLKVHEKGIDGTINGINYKIIVDESGKYYETEDRIIYKYNADYEINDKHFCDEVLFVEYMGQYIMLGFFIKDNLIIYGCERIKGKDL